MTAGDGAGTGGRSRIALSIAAAWLVSLGFDVFLHGGLLARLYMEPSSFLLAPADAFRRIPLGYLAFLVLTAALYWLLRRLGVSGAVAGFRYGAAAGAVMWGSFTVGLFSISTATLPLLAGWWIGQTVELGLAGAVLGAALNGAVEAHLGFGSGCGGSLFRRDRRYAVAWLGPGRKNRAMSRAS